MPCSSVPSRRRPLAALLGLALGLFLAVPGHAAGLASAAQEGALALESRASEVEALLQQLLASGEVTPVYADLGGGFHSVSIQLPEEVRERLLEAFAGGEDKAAAPTFLVIAAGQQLTTPDNPTVLIHAALSNTTLGYNYWVVVLNLGNQNLVRKTTLNLTGPGRKFNQSVNVTYGAGGIWGIWRNSASVGTPGVYILKATVANAGAAVTTRSFAVNP